MERHSLELNLTQPQWLRIVMTLGVDTPEAQQVVALLKRVRCEPKKPGKAEPSALSTR